MASNSEKVQSQIAEINAQFLTAAGSGDIKKMQELLNLGAKVNGVEGQPVPLFMAVGDCNLEAVKFLIANGAKVDQIAGSNTSFFYAVEMACIVGFEKYKEILEYLLKHNADINHYNDLMFNPLKLAMVHGNVEVLQFLLKHKAPIPHTDPRGFGHSFLYQAIFDCSKKIDSENEVAANYQRSQFKILQTILPILIQHGFDINFPIKMKNAIMRRNLDGFEMVGLEDNLHLGDANFQGENAQVGVNPQVEANPQVDGNIQAEANENAQVVEAAVHRRPFPMSGYSPLLLACQFGNLPLVEFLVSQGANVNQRGGYYDAETPLIIAVRINHPSLVVYLVEKAGAKLNLIPPTEETVPYPIFTPVMYAFMNNNDETMRYLIQRGAAAEPTRVLEELINFRNLQEEDALLTKNRIIQAALRLFDYAGSSDTLPENITLKDLFESGAHLNQSTSLLGNTPLHLACMMNNIGAIRAFLKVLKEQGDDALGYTLSLKNHDGWTSFDIAAIDVKIANIFRNVLQRYADHYVFRVCSFFNQKILPPEIIQAIACVTPYANTCSGIALLSEMFDLAQKHYLMLCARHGTLETKVLKEEQGENPSNSNGSGVIQSSQSPLLQPLLFSTEKPESGSLSNLANAAENPTGKRKEPDPNKPQAR